MRLERRSAYVLTGEARQQWQHAIPGVPALRYSLTFRTLRSAEPKRALEAGADQSSRRVG